MKLPQVLLDDAESFDLIDYLREEIQRPPRSRPLKSKPSPARGSMEWVAALADEVGDGEGLIDAALRVELIATVLQGLEQSDGEGLGAPYTEEAAGIVDWILDHLNDADSLK